MMYSVFFIHKLPYIRLVKNVKIEEGTKGVVSPPGFSEGGTCPLVSSACQSPGLETTGSRDNLASLRQFAGVSMRLNQTGFKTHRLYEF